MRETTITTISMKKRYPFLSSVASKRRSSHEHALWKCRFELGLSGEYLRRRRRLPGAFNPRRRHCRWDITDKVEKRQIDRRREQYVNLLTLDVSCPDFAVLLVPQLTLTVVSLCTWSACQPHSSTVADHDGMVQFEVPRSPWTWRLTTTVHWRSVHNGVFNDRRGKLWQSVALPVIEQNDVALHRAKQTNTIKAEGKKIMASFSWFTLSALLVGCGLLVSAQPTPLREFESDVKQGEFMFSPCPRGPPCYSQNVTGFGRPRTWASGYINFGLFTTDPTGSGCGQTIYVMRGVNRGELEAYSSVQSLQAKTPERTIRTSNRQVLGNGGVVFNNSYYYIQFSGTPEVTSLFTRLDLSTDTIDRTVPTPFGEGVGLGYQFQGIGGPDFAVSETGLYAIYSQKEAPHNLAVSKINPNDLSIESTIVTSKRMSSYGECFIVCAKLYCIGSYQARNTITSFVYDLYKETEITQPLPFRNQYGYTNMLDYNPADRKLYGWDSGRLITYDVNFTSWCAKEEASFKV